jgi:hypothetical protein
MKPKLLLFLAMGSVILVIVASLFTFYRPPAKPTTAPSSVWVYGCGVEKQIPLASGVTLPLHEILQKAGRLPPSVNQINLQAGAISYSSSPSKATATNGDGLLPVHAGDSITLLHGIKWQ